MLRALLLYLANQPPVYRFVMRQGLLRDMAWRYVAGESLADGVQAARTLNAQGLRVTLDHLGESVTNAAEASAAADAYLETLQAIASQGLDATVSLKLTAMGLDIGQEVCTANLRRVLDCAQQVHHGVFVRIDMESSAYTDRTLEIHRALWDRGYREVGIVLQASLYRTAVDVERAIQAGIRVRLCKGAYLEPPEVAWPHKRQVDESFSRHMERLMLEGVYPAIATHDDRIIRHALAFARTHDISPERFELQMLYGVRRDLQLKLARQGYRVRVYVPFGKQWYPYLVRRLAERPANLGFFLGSFAREALAPRTKGRKERAA